MTCIACWPRAKREVPLALRFRPPASVPQTGERAGEKSSRRLDHGIVPDPVESWDGCVGSSGEKRVDRGRDGDGIVHAPDDVQGRGVGLDGPGEPRLVTPTLFYLADQAGEHEMPVVLHDLFHRGVE
jgi:hypothetical protein